MKVSAIIPAAGSGNRFGESKQFKILAGRPMFFHTLNPFINSDKIDEIILVVPEQAVEQVHNDVFSISSKPIKVVSGGRKRQDSVNNGVRAVNSESELICIHDAARPFVTEELISSSINACDNHDGAVVGFPCQDTVKLSEKGLIKRTLDRETIWLAQTPQTFHKNKLIKSILNAESNGFTGTDEATLMEAMGFLVALVQGHVNNFKVTTQGDWERAEQLIQLQNRKDIRA
ncbi:MAG: 2-C-methyl-D-erythritol 4-phosphate cytidylyltransferase [Candidatus Neomarinimicrobiota bacterium]|nr:2-C-methyl-D-erythritol 4-phosphate cytidylyltransferase [Candidatus Neomarinimicrobiota bacterium]